MQKFYIYNKTKNLYFAGISIEGFILYSKIPVLKIIDVDSIVSLLCCICFYCNEDCAWEKIKAED